MKTFIGCSIYTDIFKQNNFYTTYVIAFLVYLFGLELKSQKQPSIGVLPKRCSKNMQKIFRRTPIPAVLL